ncbi:MAG TPA: hypothetical protein VEL28_16445 [Candidatus Binatia bacterium]|nr:hypothetical protein [Candidatus Binatia bacterium]
MKAESTKRTSPRKVVLSLAAAMCVAMAGEAAAVNNCGTISANTSLSGDVTVSGTVGPCFQITGGADLNLNGHKIKCPLNMDGTPNCPQHAAIECSTSGSNHVNSIVQGGAIDGNFPTAVVDCGTVKEVKITGATNGISWTGTSNGKDYLRNVIQLAGTTGIGINMSLADADDAINDNRIDGGGTGIKISGRSQANGPRVYENVIRGYTSYGVLNVDTSHVRLEDNVIIEGLAGSDPISVQSTNFVRTDIVCEKDKLAGGESSKCNCELDTYAVPDDCFTP